MSDSGFGSAGIGGALTTEQVDSAVLTPLLATAVVLQAYEDAGRRVYIADRGVPLRLPKLDLTVVDPWKGENALIGEANANYDSVELLGPAIKSLKQIHRLSSELVQYSIADALGEIGKAIVKKLGLTLDNAFLNGASSDGGPEGLIPLAGQSLALDAEMIVDHAHDAVGLSLGADAKPSAWFMNPRAYTALRKTKATGSGEYMLEPDPTAAGRYTLIGIPVYPTTQLKVTAHAGFEQTDLLLVDLEQIAIARGRELTVLIDASRYLDYDQIAVRVVGRWDLNSINEDGIVHISDVHIPAMPGDVLFS